MVARSDRAWFLTCALLCAGASCGQFGNTFAYTGDDALRDAANVHWVNFGGFTNNFLVEDEELLWPWMPSLFYEHGYLVNPSNGTANISLNVSPEIFLTTLFMGRITGTAELVLLKEAMNKPERGLGLRIGAGYSALGSTFGFTEATPIVRAGLLFGNVRATYAYSVGSRAIIDHQIGIGIKFDW